MSLRLIAGCCTWGGDKRSRGPLPALSGRIAAPRPIALETQTPREDRIPTLAPPPIPETPEEQRARILRQSNDRLTPTVYDDVYSLGYEPESWDGMWRIPDVRYPVLWLTSRWALVREVVEEPGSHRAEYDLFGRQRRRWVLQRVVR